MSTRRMATMGGIIAAAGFAPIVMAQPAFIPTGHLPGVPAESQMTAISGNGQHAAGRSIVDGANSSGTYWTQSTGLVNVGQFLGSATTSWDVSNNGTVVGVGLAGPLNDAERAFRWTQGGGFEALGAPAGFVTSQANGISSDSSVIVGRAGGSGLTTTAFRWTESDGIQSMGLGPFTVTAANAVSSDGSVIVGDATRPGAFSVPFRWDETNGYSEIPGLSPFFAFSRAFDVSSDGTTIVGWSFNTQNQVEAFRWRDDTGTVALGAFDPGTFTRESYATGVSGDGSIIVGASRAPDTQHAFIWTESLGFTDLQTHLETDFGIDFLGWTLEEASGISDDGTVISGWGFDPDGVRTGWIVTIPTPASATVLSLGLLAGARRRR